MTQERTPMMRQYLAAKAKFKDAILFFRMGDFYEMFFDDAKLASRVLGLTLTSRSKDDEAVPMAGVPYHAADGYLRRLIQAGYRVAICDQVEDPKLAKGLVRREVTRIVTPGTLTDEALLPERRPNYLAAICPGQASKATGSGFGVRGSESGVQGSEKAVRGGLTLRPEGDEPPEISNASRKKGSGTLTAGSPTPFSGSDRKSEIHSPPSAIRRPQFVGLAWVELSTGEFRAMDCPAERCLDELARLEAAECLIPELVAGTDLATRAAGLVRSPLVKRPDWTFDRDGAVRTLSEHFQVATLEGFGVADLGPGVAAAGALLVYLQETQKTSLAHIGKITAVTTGGRLFLDQTTQASLELVRPLRPGGGQGGNETLLDVLDRSATAPGARLLREWLLAPLAEAGPIEERLDAVAEFVRDGALRDAVRATLGQTADIERIAGRVSTGRATPRDLVGLARTLALLPQVKAKLVGRQPALLERLESQLDLLDDVRALVERSIAEDPPVHLDQGGIIRAGYSAELDDLRATAGGGKDWLVRFEAAERQRTGIPSLKVGFNNVFGYYLEVTHVHAARVPDNYTRKQTLKNAERYITPELKEHETRVLSAEERSRELEYELFVHVRGEVGRHVRRIQATAAALAAVDVLSTFAAVAVSQNYCRPRILPEPVLRLTDGRHPVLEVAMKDEPFVPNDTRLGGDDGLLMVITGPNMAGKSTYIRQVALLVIMAQAGCFVPARAAEVGLTDRIFTRVGATDQLVRGMSTFMVEMTETATILNNATPRSLVILDEVGRGTGTFDGLAIAWAVTEFLHARVQARTLFATHYHEITELAAVLPGVRNYNVAVREWGDQVVFLHKIQPGGSDQSYGLHVARLAGVPREVLQRAKEVLAQLEEIALDSEGKPRLAGQPAHLRPRKPKHLQLSLFGAAPHPVVQELKKLDVDNLTPLDALNVLKRLKDDLEKP